MIDIVVNISGDFNASLAHLVIYVGMFFHWKIMQHQLSMRILQYDNQANIPRFHGIVTLLT